MLKILYFGVITEADTSSRGVIGAYSIKGLSFREPMDKGDPVHG
jgi:hypothetical protein